MRYLFNYHWFSCYHDNSVQAHAHYFTRVPNAKKMMEIEKKCVLVCLGERKREVAFMGDKEDAKKERSHFIAAIKKTFSDIGLESFDSFVLQVKDENWAGEFVDIGSDDRVGHKCVVKVVLEVSSFIY